MIADGQHPMSSFIK